LKKKRGTEKVSFQIVSGPKEIQKYKRKLGGGKKKKRKKGGSRKMILIQDSVFRVHLWGLSNRKKKKARGPIRDLKIILDESGKVFYRT